MNTIRKHVDFLSLDRTYEELKQDSYGKINNSLTKFGSYL